MADKIKTLRQLKLVASFVDGDTRTLIVKDPKLTLTEEDFAADTTLTKAASKALVGDRHGAAFNRWKSAKLVEQTLKIFDLRKEH